VVAAEGAADMMRTFGVPLLCTVLTMGGLLLALASDGPMETIGVAGVATPLLLLGWKLR